MSVTVAVSDLDPTLVNRKTWPRWLWRFEQSKRPVMGVLVWLLAGQSGSRRGSMPRHKNARVGK